MNTSKPFCPKMVKTSIQVKSSSSNGRYRKRPTFGPISGPSFGPAHGPIIPMIPLYMLQRGQTQELGHDHEHGHGHQHMHGGYKRSCHGHCSKSKVKPVQEIKISEAIFGKNAMKLPKIPNREFINDPKFQESVIRDLLSMVDNKVGKNKHIIGEIKEEIFRHFKYEKKKVDSIVNYIDTILIATEKTNAEAKNTINFMQETRDKCQKLDIQMEDFLEGVRESLTSLKKEEIKTALI